MTTTGLRRVLGAGLLVLVGAATATVCGSGGSGDDGDASATIPTTTIDDGTTTTTTTTVDDGPDAGGSSSTTTGELTPGTSEPGPPVGPTPTIAGFALPGSIDCGTGDLQLFTVSWTTTDAAEVTISVDGLAYDTFPADGDARLPFSCSSSHAYTLTATGDGGRTAARTGTIRPQNVQSGPGPRDT